MPDVVYVLFVGMYSDYSVVGVYSSLEKAQEKAKFDNPMVSNWVEEPIGRSWVSEGDFFPNPFTIEEIVVDGGLPPSK